MKRVLPVLMGFVFLLLSSTEGWSLPPCKGSPTSDVSTMFSWTDCSGTVTYASGAKYVGEFKDGKEHGQAILYNADGTVIREGIFEKGNFLHAKKPSPTVITKKTPSNGSSFLICPANGVWSNCFGTYTYTNGDKYVGEWKNGKRNGYGTYAFANGNKYVGEWKSGKPDFNRIVHNSLVFRYVQSSEYYRLPSFEKLRQWKVDIANGAFPDELLPLPKRKRVEYSSESHSSKNSANLFIKKFNEYCPGYYNRDWNNCWGTRIFNNGSKYVGRWKLGDQHGQGTLTYTNGNKYVGEWKNSKKNGYGRYAFANGNKYVGEFKDGKRNGEGTFTYANVDKYVGEYRDDKKHGQGTYTFGPKSIWAGNKYVGEFKDDKPNGQGIRYNTYGTVYQEGIFENGRFLHAKKSPSTVIARKPSSTVTAEKVPTKRSSFPPCPGSPTSDYYAMKTWTDCEGTSTYAKGNKYVGEWKDGTRHGKGTFTFDDGRMKRGIWESNKFLYAKKLSPTITSNQPCPGTYKPTWDNCTGTRTFHSGSKYVGGWKKGKWHGEGTLTYADGEKYVGGFKNGLHHGKGTITHANGKTLKGIW